MVSQQGYIYIIQSGEYFKIGFSIKPAQRVKEVRYFRRPKLTNEPTVLHSIAVENMRESETVLHALLQLTRVEGEWFILSDEELEWLLSLTPDSLSDLVERFRQTVIKPVPPGLYQFRIREVAEARRMNCNQLYQAINTARAYRGENFLSMITMRKYWQGHLDQFSWSLIQEIAQALGVSERDLFPAGM